MVAMIAIAIVTSSSVKPAAARQRRRSAIGLSVIIGG
jgi:hypothetical protein